MPRRGAVCHSAQHGRRRGKGDERSEADVHDRDERARSHGGLYILAKSLEHHALRVKLDGWLRSALVDLVEKHGPDVSQFIHERVGRWDAAQLTTKLEESVGRDLQYIRLNGTLVGGLIGLLIFTLSQWIW